MSATGDGEAAAAGPEAKAEQDAFVIVTGLSGSGKSLAHRCFEDMGYFCIDNLPSSLILKFSDMKALGGPALGRVALTVDVREREFLGEFPSVHEELRRRHADVRLLFLEADDQTLVRRFSESRRPHPLAGDRPLLDGIAEERRLLAALRDDAQIVIDTSTLTAHELRDQLWNRFGQEAAAHRFHVSLLSFGYRHGVPPQADLVFDVRFLPNPYYVPELRPLSGQDAPIRAFLDEREEYRTFVEHLTRMLDFLLPAYEKEGKSYLTIAVGCTGGRHRSVAITEELHELLRSRPFSLSKSHRDCDQHPA